MFNKRKWVVDNLKSGFDTKQFTKEWVMTLAMDYSKAGVLNDNDLAVGNSRYLRINIF